MNLTAFFSFLITATLTPGPNNITAMAMARKYGFRNSLKCILGYVIGYSVLMAAAWFFSAKLYALIPAVKPYMLALGCCYMLWLAWHILRDEDATDESAKIDADNAKAAANDAGGASGIPTTFGFIRQSLLLMLLNVKAVIYAITVWSSFLLPSYTDSSTLFLFYIFVVLIGPAASTVWAALGATMNRLFSRYGKIINAVMAAGLVWCAWTLIAR